MRLSIKAKFYILLYLIYPFTSLGLGLIISLLWENHGILSKSLLFLLYVWIIILVIIIHKLKCPNCNTPLNKFKLIPFDFEFILPKKCRNCGYDLSIPYNENNKKSYS